MYVPAVLAYTFGKLLWHTTRLTRIGGGSAAPGLLALKLNPNLLTNIRSQITGPCIIIAGTNGKTTTAALIRSTLAQDNSAILHNATGSNLSRGIVSAYIHNYQLFSIQTTYSAAVIEVDEAVLPQVLSTLRPSHLVLTNLFRDQLDRYGEVESIKKKWLDALHSLTSPCNVFGNIADPQIAHLISQLHNSYLNTHTYLLQEQTVSASEPNQNILAPLEQGICPQCSNLLTFNHSAIIGQGSFNCPNCNFQNLHPDFILDRYPNYDELTTNNSESSPTKRLQTSHKDAISLQNTLAAYTVIHHLRCNTTFDELAQNSPQKFGRFEKIHTSSGEMMLVLIKNPTGFTESLRSLTHQSYNFQTAAFILNDNLADGQDVSWIWDVPLHKYLPTTTYDIYVSGSRSLDMALRLQYSSRVEPVHISELQITQLMHKLIQKPGTTVIFATYTAMLEIQSWLAVNKIKNAYWK